MRTGSIVSIYMTLAARATPLEVEEALAVQGQGLEGDRYATNAGTYSNQPGPDREVTLI